MFKLRPYQDAAVGALFDWFAEQTGNPLVVMPTGTGKALTIAAFIRRALVEYPQTRVLMLCHVRELIRQNADTLIRLWPDCPIGVCSAGLGRADMYHQVLFAGIQSIHRKADDIPCPDLIIVDEAHLIPRKQATMYGAFLARLKERNPYLKIIGFTATEYRLDSGYMHKGEGAIFDGIAYEYKITDAIKGGWLCEPIPKSMATKLDASGVKKQGGDFKAGDLERAVDVDPITRAACAEIIAYGANRKSWLVFSSGVKHARHICDALIDLGIRAAVVDGDTSFAERDATIAEFKLGNVQCLVGARIFTTGFDAPNLDLIADLNPTDSTGLHVQKVGRGTRIHPSAYFDGFNEATAADRIASIASSPKPNCLYLDFAGNAARHGPLDALVVREPGKGGGGEAPVKECPDCFEHIHASIRVCPYCGHEFPPPETKLKPVASSDALLSTQIKPEWLDVTSVGYFKHMKAGGAPTMRVEYRCGLMQHKEWVCIEHAGYARQEACRWWQTRSTGEVPHTVDDALKNLHDLKKPSRILVRKNGKFFEIINAEF